MGIIIGEYAPNAACISVTHDILLLVRVLLMEALAHAVDDAVAYCGAEAVAPERAVVIIAIDDCIQHVREERSKTHRSDRHPFNLERTVRGVHGVATWDRAAGDKQGATWSRRWRL